MTAPNTSLATLRPDLSGSLVEFDLQMNQMGYIGLQLAPVIDVGKPFGRFGRIPLKELLKTRNTDRAPGAGYSRGSGKFEPDSYNTEEHGTEEPIDDRESEMYSDYFDSEQLATIRSRNIVLEAYEQRIIALALGNSHTSAAGTAWTNTTGSSPIANVRTAVENIYGRSGMVVNTMVISWKRFNVLKDNDEIIDRVKSWGGQNPNRGAVNAAAIAQALGLEQVIVAGSVKNTANENQDAVVASLWDDTKALLCRVAKTRDHREPCLLRTFHYAADGSNIGAAIETYRDETVRSNIVRARMDTDEKVMYEEAGEIITGV